MIFLDRREDNSFFSYATFCDLFPLKPCHPLSPLLFEPSFSLCPLFLSCNLVSYSKSFTFGVGFILEGSFCWTLYDSWEFRALHYCVLRQDCIHVFAFHLQLGACKNLPQFLSLFSYLFSQFLERPRPVLRSIHNDFWVLRPHRIRL